MRASPEWAIHMAPNSYSSLEFDLFYSEHTIITLCMPSYSSHLLQLLDISCFAVLKQSYGRQIEEYIQAGISYINKPDFLMAYVLAREKNIAINTIRSGFTATGLVLYNPEQMLSKLNTQLRTPTPPATILPVQGPWVPETPHNISQLELQAQAIKGYISRRTTSPANPTDLVLNQLVKNYQIAIHNAILLAEENKQLRIANKRQKKKQARRREYIATRGILIVKEGLSRAQISNIGPNSRITDQAAAVQPRAPRMYSICRSLEHTARTCLQKYISN
jgi:hypothetical protein